MNPLAWTVTLYPCEWGGRTFHIPTWAVISENDQEQDRTTLTMDTPILWGHRYIHRHLATGMAIDIDLIEAQAQALERKYSEAPVKLSSEEVELGQKVFELLCKVALVNNFDSVMDPLLNVLTANHWAEPIAPELPELVQSWSVRSEGHLQEGATPPDIGFVHLKYGNVRAITLGRDPKTHLLRAVTLQDYEPDEVPFEDYLWRYSLLLVPDIAFTPDHSKFSWMQLWMHTRFFWSACLDDFGTDKYYSRIAVATSQTLGEGLPLFKMMASYPRSSILGRPDSPTEEELKAFNEAYKADPTIDQELWFSYLDPTDAAIAAHVAKCKANPVPFTKEEVGILGQILSFRNGTIHISEALKIIGSWRWDEALNTVYEEDVPEFRRNRETSVSQSDLILPAEGFLVLACGEVPAVAVSREAGTGRLRVVTTDESDCTCESVGFEIFKYDVFEIEDSVFRSETGSSLVPGIRTEPWGTA